MAAVSENPGNGVAAANDDTNPVVVDAGGKVEVVVEGKGGEGEGSSEEKDAGEAQHVEGKAAARLVDSDAPKTTAAPTA